MAKEQTSRKTKSWLPFGKSGRVRSAAGLVVLGAAVFCLPAMAGTYKTSAHGNSTTGLYRNAGGVNWLNAPYSYSRGNCAHCHEEHASMGGAEGIPPAAATGSASVYLGFEVEENLCFGCHNVAVPVGTATDKIKTDTDKVYGHGTGTTLNIMGVSGRHRANETSVTGVSTSAHVECTDCHNPHMARTGNHTAGTGGNAITGPSPLEGVAGVDFSAYPSNWANLATWSAAAGVNAYATATKEYQICFKCHSSANGSTDDWDGNPGSGAEWTDTALEFNPANYAMHPVVVTLDAGAANTEALDAGQLIAPWVANRGSQTMYCTDCHASNSSVAGPHGSSIKWMLAGPNKAWPYDSAAKNGTASAIQNDYRVLTNTLSGDGYNDNLGTDDGLFCRNCHPNTNNSAINKAHKEHDTRDSVCVICHIRVPHGGKVSSLIAATGDASGTGWGNLPARYRPDGNGGAPWNARMYRFQKTTAADYNKSNCRADGTDRGSGCGDHNSETACTGAGCVW